MDGIFTLIQFFQGQFLSLALVVNSLANEGNGYNEFWFLPFVNYGTYDQSTLLQLLLVHKIQKATFSYKRFC